MSRSSHWALLARYLSGECSKEEQAQVEALMASDPETQRLVVSMRRVWDTPDSTAGTSDVNKLWDEVAVNTGIAATSTATQIPTPQQTIRRQWFIPIRRYAVAAALLLVCSLAYYWAQETLLSPADMQATEWVTLQVENGTDNTLTLSDGTRIRLDAGSSLQYPSTFSANHRTVMLNGEGYFEVASNPDKPFIVHANQAVVTVLGTKFNLRAWQPEQRITVAVAEGRVALAPQGNTQEAVEIAQGQMSILPHNGPPLAPHAASIAKHLGWMQQEAFFEDAPLHEILYQLERWYNIKFVLNDTTIAKEHLTLQLQAQSLEDVLELVAALTGLEYQHTDGTVLLTVKE